MLARELETGTFRFARTAGFGRLRWTLAKLVALPVVVTTAAGAISVLFSWYNQPYLATGNQAVSPNAASPYSSALFDLRGVAFAAWTLVAFAIGGLAGMLIRRVVPATVATMVAYTAFNLVAANVLCQQYLTRFTTTRTFPGAAWIYSQWWTKSGELRSPARGTPPKTSSTLGPTGRSPRKPSKATLAECFASTATSS